MSQVILLDANPIGLVWAQARQQGQPTAGDKTIDGDIILVAQAVTIIGAVLRSQHPILIIYLGLFQPICDKT